MNQQNPPIDQDVRAQLARRSAGRLPEGLTTQVLQAVDRAPVKPRYTWRPFSPQPARAIPRTLLAGAGLAAVVLLASALLVVPRLQTTPASGLAGYPADRALTTTELASLMAGPALPTNTALVASVTIDPRTDVCPMDRYGTLGVVDGMSSQVCVMGTFDPYTSRTTATFAFRYLAPGYLGLLGAIVSPSELGAASNSKLAFRPSEQWPNVQSDKPFLVEGWLGSSSPPQSVGSIGIVCPQPLYGVGDPLDPMGPDNTCNTTWLADDPSTVPSWEIADGRLVVSVQGGHEAFAGGARFYDSIPNDAPVKGVYVVRSEASAVSCGLPSCREWVVVAKVAEILLPQATAAPTASLSGYPAGRALTAAELASLMAGPALPTNTALVASVTIDAKTDVCPMNRYPTIGVVEGMGMQVCVMGAGVSTYLSTPKAAGVFAFRYLAPGVLGLIGEITPASSNKTAFRVVDDWPLQGKTFLVDGWLGAVGLLVQCTLAPTAGDVLLPNGDDCPYDDWLGDDSDAPGIHADHGYAPGSPSPSYDPLSLRGNARHVGAGGMRLIDSLDPATPVHGVFVVRSVTEGCPGDSPISSRGCPAWRVLAKVADVSLPVPTATPRLMPTGTPGAPATPLAPSLAGVIGAGNRPLSVDELVGLMLTQPDHLAGRIVIAKAPIPTYIYCHPDSPDSNGLGCTIDNARQAETGDWAVSIGADGTLSLIGQMSTPTTGGYVFTLQQLQGKSGGPDTGLVIVDAWLDWENRCDTLPTEPPDRVCFFSLLFPEKPNWMHMTPDSTAQYVEPNDAYHIYGSQASGSQAIHGLYLMRVDTGSPPTMLAQLETAIPSPAPVTIPPATPIAIPVASSGGSGVAPSALFGGGNRPLTEGEFATLWAADPAHLAGRIAIVKGPVPTGFECRSAGAADAAVPSPGCHIAILDGFIAQEGYWAVRVGAGGKLAIVGELSMPTRAGFVFSVEDACLDTNLEAGAVLVVLATLYDDGAGSWRLAQVGTSASCGAIDLGGGSYESMGPSLPSGYAGEPPRAYYLVRVGTPWSVLARMEVAVP